MAKFFKKLNITDKPVEENMSPETPENLSMEFLTQDRVKANIETLVKERLSKLAETDFDALFSQHELLMKEEKERKRNSTGRRRASSEGQISFSDIADVEKFSPKPEPEPELAITPEPEPAPEPVFEEKHEEPKEPNRYIGKFMACFDFFASGALLEMGRSKIKTGFGNVFSVCIVAVLKVYSGFEKIKSKALNAFRKIPVYPRLFNKSIGRKHKKARAAKYVLVIFRRRVVRSERKVSSHVANLVAGIDKRNDILVEKTTDIAVSGSMRVNHAREWADFNQRKLLAGLVVCIVAAVTTVSVLNYFTAYVYAYNGRALGMVKNQEDVLRVLDVVSEQLSREYGADIEIQQDQEITFEKVFSTNVNDEIDDMQEVFNRLTYMQDMNVRAYALYIDNKRIAIFDSEKHAQNLLDSFRDIYLQNAQYSNVNYENVSFAENVDIVPYDTQLGKIQNPDDVIDVMLTGAVAEKVHIVEKGETFSGIAKMFGLTQAELEASNPGITPARLSIGQEITLTQAVPLLTVQTVEIATYSDIIPYETVYEDNPKIYKGEQSTRVKGVNGEREVTARIVRNNGFEIAREELNSVVISPPSSAVVMRGTKDPPPLQGTGRLKAPVSGYRLTSKFGMRSGRMHSGIDMACKSGTSIRAADGGTVIFAGYNGSLGYTIKIDHGGNMVTMYGHCSALFVKKGDKVYQGQHIANVGSTGRSTGPHLHFEVQINGVPKNPLSYL